MASPAGGAAAATSVPPIEVSYADVPAVHLPLALARLHRAMRPAAALELAVLAGDEEGEGPARSYRRRRVAPLWRPEVLHDVVVGAGFTIDSLTVDDGVVRATGRRARSLPDTVGAGMRLLVCGLNPSEYAADRGVGYARPGNRFWPAALEAGLVSRSHDPWHALLTHGVGMTDMVKRATARASELGRDEYRSGRERVERLVRWLQPAAVCFVGMQGWRAAVDADAVAGLQPAPFGGRPAYVMPSTSGLNARSSRAELAAHLGAAAALADDAGAGGGLTPLAPRSGSSPPGAAQL